MHILAVANQKGGVGKTSLVIHLAHFAAEQGKRVLIIDTDEADVGAFYQVDDHTLAEPTVLCASHLFTSDHAEKAPLSVAPNIWYVPADPAVKDVDDLPLEIILQPRNALQVIATDYDLVLIDTPPNLQRRMLGALTAAHAVVSPTTISIFALHRIQGFMEAVGHVQDNFNPALQHIGLLPSIVNSRSKNETEALPELRDAYGDWLLPTVIHSRACVVTTQVEGKPVWWSLRNGANRVAAAEIRAACAEILRRLEGVTA